MRALALILPLILGMALETGAAHPSFRSRDGSLESSTPPHAVSPRPRGVGVGATGKIGGIIFDDLDANGARDGLDVARAGVRVFLDLDDDGRLDDGEPMTTTDATGAYLFESVAAGTYTIRPAIAPGMLTTLPPILPEGAGTLTFVDQIQDEDGNVQLPAPNSLAVSPDGQNLYAGSANQHLATFFRSAAGEWTFDPFGTLAVGASDLAMSSDSLFVYAVGEPDALTVLERDPTTGRLTVVQVFQDTTVPAGQHIAGATLVTGLRTSAQFETAIARSADDQFVYTASRNDDTILVFGRSATTGALTLVQTLTDNTLSDNGTTPDKLNGAKDLVASPDDAHVYVVAMDEARVGGGNAGSLTVFDRDGGTGMLTQIQAVQTGAFTQLGVTVSPDGATVYEATRSTGSSGRLDVFLRDTGVQNPTFGELTLVQTLTNNSGGIVGIAGAADPTVSADGASLYLASLSSSTLTTFARDPNGASPTFGQLTLQQVFQDDMPPIGLDVPSATEVSGLGFAQRAVVGPDDDEVFTVAPSGNAVITFDRDTATGLLTHDQTLKDGQGGTNGLRAPQQIVVAPDGAHAYVLSDIDDAVLTMERDAATGVLTFLETHQDPDNLDRIPFANTADGLHGVGSGALSPDGRFLYVTGTDDDAIVVFSRDLPTGVLSVVQTLQDGENADPIAGATAVPTLERVRGLQLSPDGAHAYVFSDDGPVVVLARDATTGLLSFVQTVASGFGPLGELALPTALTFSRDGAHAYIDATSIGITNLLSVFSRDASTGVLIPAGLVDPGPGNDFFAGSARVTFTPDGAGAFVSDGLRPGTPVYLRDPTTGLLTFDHVETGLASQPIFSPDGFFAFVFDTGGASTVLDVFLHDPVSCTLTFSKTITADIDDVRSLVFSTDAAHAYGLISSGFRVFDHDGGNALPGTYRVFVAESAVVTGRDFGLHTNSIGVAANQPDAAELGAVAGQLTIARAGDTTLDLPVHYTIGGTAKNGVDYTLIADAVMIPAGQESVTIDIDPDDDGEAEGAESVIITLDTDPAYRLSPSMARAAVTIADDDGVEVVFDRPLVFTDADGTGVTLVAKAASGSALFSGNAVQIAIGSTTTTVTGGSLALASVHLTEVASGAALTIKTKGGDGRVEVGNLRIDGPLKKLAAKTTDLADCGSLSIGGDVADRAVKITLGSLSNAAIVSATPIASLTVDRWRDLDPDTAPDALTAPWVGKLATRTGAFMASVVLSGASAPKGVTLKSARIKGPLGSNDTSHPAVWRITGDVGSIAAGDVDGWTLQLMSSVKRLKFAAILQASVLVDDQVGTLRADRWDEGILAATFVKTIKTRGDFGASILAAALGKATFKGDLADATITLTQPVGATPAAKAIKVGGVIRDTLIESDGNIDRIEAAALHESAIRLGVDSSVADDVLPENASELNTPAVLKRLKLKGVKNGAESAFRGSIIAATIGRKLRLGTVESTNGGIVFGLALGEFDSIEFVLNGAKTKLQSPADVAPGPIADDFVVRVL